MRSLPISWRKFSQPALGSQVEGILYSKVNNNLYWVAPLLHSGFLNGLTIKKELQDMLVSATNERDVRLVQNVAGKAIKIKYQQGAYFQSDIHRHVYFNGNASRV
jgi:hypothetical protein